MGNVEFYVSRKIFQESIAAGRWAYFGRNQRRNSNIYEKNKVHKLFGILTLSAAS